MLRGSQGMYSGMDDEKHSNDVGRVSQPKIIKLGPQNGASVVQTQIAPATVNVGGPSGISPMPFVPQKILIPKTRRNSPSPNISQDEAEITKSRSPRQPHPVPGGRQRRPITTRVSSPTKKKSMQHERVKPTKPRPPHRLTTSQRRPQSHAARLARELDTEDIVALCSTDGLHEPGKPAGLRPAAPNAQQRMELTHEQLAALSSAPDILRQLVPFIPQTQSPSRPRPSQNNTKEVDKPHRPTSIDEKISKIDVLHEPVPQSVRTKQYNIPDANELALAALRQERQRRLEEKKRAEEEKKRKDDLAAFSQRIQQRNAKRVHDAKQTDEANKENQPAESQPSRRGRSTPASSKPTAKPASARATPRAGSTKLRLRKGKPRKPKVRKAPSTQTKKPEGTGAPTKSGDLMADLDDMFKKGGGDTNAKESTDTPVRRKPPLPDAAKVRRKRSASSSKPKKKNRAKAKPSSHDEKKPAASDANTDIENMFASDKKEEEVDPKEEAKKEKIRQYLKQKQKAKRQEAKRKKLEAKEREERRLANLRKLEGYYRSKPDAQEQKAGGNENGHPPSQQRRKRAQPPPSAIHIEISAKKLRSPPTNPRGISPTGSPVRVFALPREQSTQPPPQPEPAPDQNTIRELQQRLSLMLQYAQNIDRRRTEAHPMKPPPNPAPLDRNVTRPVISAPASVDPEGLKQRVASLRSMADNLSTRLHRLADHKVLRGGLPSEPTSDHSDRDHSVEHSDREASVSSPSSHPDTESKHAHSESSSQVLEASVEREDKELLGMIHSIAKSASPPREVTHEDTLQMAISSIERAFRAHQLQPSSSSSGPLLTRDIEESIQQAVRQELDSDIDDMDSVSAGSDERTEDVARTSEPEPVPVHTLKPRYRWQPPHLDDSEEEAEDVLRASPSIQSDAYNVVNLFVHSILDRRKELECGSVTSDRSDPSELSEINDPLDAPVKDDTLSEDEAGESTSEHDARDVPPVSGPPLPATPHEETTQPDTAVEPYTEVAREQKKPFLPKSDGPSVPDDEKYAPQSDHTFLPEYQEPVPVARGAGPDSDSTELKMSPEDLSQTLVTELYLLDALRDSQLQLEALEQTHALSKVEHEAQNMAKLFEDTMQGSTQEQQHEQELVLNAMKSKLAAQQAALQQQIDEIRHQHELTLQHERETLTASTERALLKQKEVEHENERLKRLLEERQATQRAREQEAQRHSSQLQKAISSHEEQLGVIRAQQAELRAMNETIREVSKTALERPITVVVENKAGPPTGVTQQSLNAVEPTAPHTLSPAAPVAPTTPEVSAAEHSHVDSYADDFESFVDTDTDAERRVPAPIAQSQTVETDICMSVDDYVDPAKATQMSMAEELPAESSLNNSGIKEYYAPAGPSMSQLSLAEEIEFDSAEDTPREQAALPVDASELSLAEEIEVEESLVADPDRKTMQSSVSIVEDISALPPQLASQQSMPEFIDEESVDIVFSADESNKDPVDVGAQSASEYTADFETDAEIDAPQAQVDAKKSSEAKPVASGREENFTNDMSQLEHDLLRQEVEMLKAREYEVDRRREVQLQYLKALAGGEIQGKAPLSAADLQYETRKVDTKHQVERAEIQQLRAGVELRLHRHQANMLKQSRQLQRSQHKTDKLAQKVAGKQPNSSESDSEAVSVFSWAREPAAVVLPARGLPPLVHAQPRTSVPSQAVPARPYDDLHSGTDISFDEDQISIEHAPSSAPEASQPVSADKEPALPPINDSSSGSIEISFDEDVDAPSEQPAQTQAQPRPAADTPSAPAPAEAEHSTTIGDANAPLDVDTAEISEDIDSEVEFSEPDVVTEDLSADQHHGEDIDAQYAPPQPLQKPLDHSTLDGGDVSEALEHFRAEISASRSDLEASAKHEAKGGQPLGAAVLEDMLDPDQVAAMLDEEGDGAGTPTPALDEPVITSNIEDEYASESFEEDFSQSYVQETPVAVNVPPATINEVEQPAANVPPATVNEVEQPAAEESYYKDSFEQSFEVDDDITENLSGQEVSEDDSLHAESTDLAALYQAAPEEDAKEPVTVTEEPRDGPAHYEPEPRVDLAQGSPAVVQPAGQEPGSPARSEDSSGLDAKLSTDNTDGPALEPTVNDAPTDQAPAGPSARARRLQVAEAVTDMLLHGILSDTSKEVTGLLKQGRSPVKTVTKQPARITPAPTPTPAAPKQQSRSLPRELKREPVVDLVPAPVIQHTRGFNRDEALADTQKEIVADHITDWLIDAALREALMHVSGIRARRFLQGDFGHPFGLASQSLPPLNPTKSMCRLKMDVEHISSYLSGLFERWPDAHNVFQLIRELSGLSLEERAAKENRLAQLPENFGCIPVAVFTEYDHDSLEQLRVDFANEPGMTEAELGTIMEAQHTFHKLIFDNLNETLLKTLMRLHRVPEPWCAGKLKNQARLQSARHMDANSVIKEIVDRFAKTDPFLDSMDMMMALRTPRGSNVKPSLALIQRERERKEFELIDKILQEELKRGTSPGALHSDDDWSDFEEEEAGVKFEIADSVLYDLLGELVDELTRMWRKRRLRAEQAEP